MIKQTLAALALMSAAPALAEPQRAAFLGVHFIDTSLNPDHAAEDVRVAALSARLVEKLAAAGRYDFVDIAPVADRVAKYDNIASCNGCDADFARELGADVAITGEVHKTSNLILAISVYVRDAQTGAMVSGGSTDIRGNNDEMWTRGVDYILKHRLLK